MLDMPSNTQRDARFSSCIQLVRKHWDVAAFWQRSAEIFCHWDSVVAHAGVSVHTGEVAHLEVVAQTVAVDHNGNAMAAQETGGPCWNDGLDTGVVVCVGMVAYMGVVAHAVVAGTGRVTHV